MVLIWGLVVTAAITAISYVESAEEVQESFAMTAQQVVDRIVEEVTLAVTAAEATRGLVVASDSVDPSEFTEFVGQIRVGERFPQLSSIALTTIVDAADADDLARQVRQETDRTFAIRPATPHDDMRWVLTYVEPLAGNEGLVGLDLRADAVTREAGIDALATRLPQMTGPLMMGQAGAERGLAVLVPVVTGSGDPLGFTSIFFLGDDLLRTALGDVDVGVVVTDDRAGEQVASYRMADEPEGGRSLALDTEVVGRPWTVAVTALETGDVPLATTVVLGASGFGVTLLLALLVANVASREQRAQDLAEIATAELRESEVALARVNAELADANEELAGRNADLQRSNVELSRFAHVASHDLKQPLQLVVAFSEMLQRSLVDRLGSEGLEQVEMIALDRIAKGAARMRLLIDDLLALADAERGPHATEPVEVAAVVEEVLQLLDHQISATEAVVEVWETDAVVMDRRQLVPLLQNLIGNAVKFRRPDAPPVVLVDAVAGGGCWTLTVTDNGMGIDPADRQVVFEAFHRLHRNADLEGSGVGLAICAAVVDGHGGDIEVGDGIDGGTRFTIRLPQ